MPVTYYVAWWNVENLFDEEHAPPDRRTEKLERAIQKDLKGWTAARRDKKITQLASVITQMNGGAGPDLLGVCEIENLFVLERLRDKIHSLLPARNYKVVHADTSDARGIDVAFFYDPARFAKPLKTETFFHVVMKRNATREIVQVNFVTKHRGRTWMIFGNHWPSRSGGQFESAGYRAIAGETLGYFHQRALEVHGEATPALAMGDFNDEPFDASLVTHALSTRQRNRVAGATRTKPFLNLMWPLMGIPDGTFFYESSPNMLDHSLVNRNMLLEDSAFRVDRKSVEILRFDGTFVSGKYRQPRPFGGMGKPVNVDGFSDHFPIGVRVIETD